MRPRRGSELSRWLNALLSASRTLISAMVSSSDLLPLAGSAAFGAKSLTPCVFTHRTRDSLVNTLCVRRN